LHISSRKVQLVSSCTFFRVTHFPCTNAPFFEKHANSCFFFAPVFEKMYKSCWVALSLRTYNLCHFLHLPFRNVQLVSSCTFLWETCYSCWVLLSLSITHFVPSCNFLRETCNLTWVALFFEKRATRHDLHLSLRKEKLMSFLNLSSIKVQLMLSSLFFK
jgi:hypothetical protein